MDNLLSIVSKYSTHEQEQTSQTTLFTIKLLAKRLGEKHPTEFSSVSSIFNSLEIQIYLLIQKYMFKVFHLELTNCLISAFANDFHFH
jgi:hypothetical protein